MRCLNKKAQNLLEYALVLSVIAFALFGMRTYFKRGIQSVIKLGADELGVQGEPMATKFKDDPGLYAQHIEDQKKIEAATKAEYYPAGNAETYYNYEKKEYVPLEDKFISTGISSEDLTIKHEEGGKVTRTINSGSAVSLDISH